MFLRIALVRSLRQRVDAPAPVQAFLRFRVENVFQADVNGLLIGMGAQIPVVVFGADPIDISRTASITTVPFVGKHAVTVTLEIFRDGETAGEFRAP